LSTCAAVSFLFAKLHERRFRQIGTLACADGDGPGTRPTLSLRATRRAVQEIRKETKKKALASEGEERARLDVLNTPLISP
jgi:hypothetical protein